MNKHIATLPLFIFGAVCHAQSNPTYIAFSPGATKGALYKPDSGPAPHVAVLLIHRTSNFMVHLGTTELAKRGFLVLGMNPRSDNNEAAVHFEDNALDMAGEPTKAATQPKPKRSRGERRRQTKARKQAVEQAHLAEIAQVSR